jgi:hypothetical protein
MTFGLGRGISLTTLTALFLLFSPLLMKAAFAQPQPTPGWYRNSGAGGPSSTIFEEPRLRITWENSYIYQHPGTDNLYWYAQITYFNKTNQPLPLTCSGVANPSLVMEHIRGTEGIPINGDGVVAAEETFCSRNPNLNHSIDPGGTHYSWAIFHNVPPGGEVSLEWMPFGRSGWVNPWQSSFNAPPPAECPQELVNFGTCVPVSRTPEGKRPNLIVLVHGCCTDAKGLREEWDSLGGEIAKKIKEDKISDKWEIVVWDWHKDTSDPVPGPAYRNADHQGRELLAPAIWSHSYNYIHMIAHSAGSNLINIAAKTLIGNNKIKQENPFIHLTFLDAYQPNNDDYGNLPGYPYHYSEHYVNRGGIPSNFTDFPFTDSCLKDAFNFDLTYWTNNDKNPFNPVSGHFWPVHWYKQSVTTSGFKFGYPLSFEGGVQTFISLYIDYPNNLECHLIDINTPCKPSTDPIYQCW